jgi:hypothetical protein
LLEKIKDDFCVILDIFLNLFSLSSPRPDFSKRAREYWEAGEKSGKKRTLSTVQEIFLKRAGMS